MGEGISTHNNPKANYLNNRTGKDPGLDLVPVCHNPIYRAPVNTVPQSSALFSSSLLQSFIYCSCKLIFLGGQMASFVPLIENQHRALHRLGSLERGPDRLALTELVREPKPLMKTRVYNSE